MPLASDDGSWRDPKWFVIGFALAAFALILHYDLRLGLAAGALLGVIAALWLYLAVRFGLLGGGGMSERRVMQERYRQQVDNRRRAATRERDDDPRSGA
ncbi:MAG: hypothetical protein ACK4MR_12965 [Erythrobacter cryptus]|jgi:hypothetical protein